MSISFKSVKELHVGDVNDVFDRMLINDYMEIYVWKLRLVLNEHYQESQEIQQRTNVILNNYNRFLTDMENQITLRQYNIHEINELCMELYNNRHTQNNIE